MKNKGITLIALVITIIILLILAGVAISSLTGENGLLKKIQKASEENSEATAKEKLELLLLDMQAEKVSNDKYNENEYLTNKIEENEMAIDGNIVTANGWKFEIDRSIPEIVKVLGKSEEYVEPKSLIAWYDGIENTENGHDYNATAWRDLTGNNETGATINGATWTPNGLLFDGSNDWVNMNSILMPETEDFTIDIVVSVYKYDSNSAYILAQCNSSANAEGRTGIGTYGNQIGFIGASCTDGNQIKVYEHKLAEKINITVTRKTNKIEIWINGQKKEEYIKEGAIISQFNTVLGRWGMYDGLYFNGVIYSVKAYNEALNAGEIQKSYNQNNKKFNIEEKAGNGEYVKTGLTAYYDGIENTGNGHDYNTTIWKDLTGNNEIGATINGATWTSNGLLFDGSNDWVNMNSILMPETEDFTIDVVASVNKYSNGVYMLAQCNSSANAGGRTGIRIDSNEVQLFGASCTGFEFIKMYETQLTEKINITVTRKSDKIELWVNGQKKAEYIKEGGIISQYNTVLGRWGMYNNYYFNGIIYSVKSYNKTLSTEEIQQNYNVNKLRFNI